jgi:hypothetical protein
MGHRRQLQKVVYKGVGGYSYVDGSDYENSCVDDISYFFQKKERKSTKKIDFFSKNCFLKKTQK